MSKKRHKPEEIVAKLRQVDVLTGQGRSSGTADPPALGVVNWMPSSVRTVRIL